MVKEFSIKFRKKVDATILMVYFLPILYSLIGTIWILLYKIPSSYVSEWVSILVVLYFNFIFLINPFLWMFILIFKGPDWVISKPVIKWLIMIFGVVGILEVLYIIRMGASILNLLLGITILSYFIPFCFFIPIFILWCRVSKPLWRSVYDRSLTRS